MTVNSVDPETFRRVCARFATGITVATCLAPDGAPQGLTANSFTSVSLMPPLVLICIDYRSSVLAHFRRSAWYGISILSEDQRELSVHFAQRSGNRFEGVEWRKGESGVPLLENALCTMECAVSQVVEAGDHAILIGEVIRGLARDGEPLLYYNSAYRRLG